VSEAARVPRCRPRAPWAGSGARGLPSAARAAAPPLRWSSARAGATLVEAVAALTAGAFVCAGMAALFQAEQRLAGSRAARLARVETDRLVAGVLRSELSTLVPDEDVGGTSGDTLALRLFRGLAVTCTPPAGAGSVPVRFEGARDPDPTKDSVIVLPAGPTMPLLASGRSASPCPGSGTLLLWELPAPVAQGTPLLLFERGTYALSGGALRLRRGREGRQPLTAELLRDAGSRFAPQYGGGGNATLRGVSISLSFASPRLERRIRIPFLNPDSTSWP